MTFMGSELALVLGFTIVVLCGIFSTENALTAAIAVLFIGLPGGAPGAILGLACVITLRNARFQPLPPSGRRLVAWASTFFAWAIFSWILNGAPSTSVGAWMIPMAERIAIAAMLMSLVVVRPMWLLIVRGLLLGGLVQGGIGLLQAAGLLETTRVAWTAPGISESRVTGTEADPNYYALGLAMTIAFALALRGTGRSVLALPTLLIAGSAIVLSLSRSGFLALAAVISVWLVALVMGRGATAGRTRALGPIMAVVAAVLISGPNQLLDRFSQVGGSQQFSSAEQRLVLWRAARQVVSDHVVAGVGPDQVRYEMARLGGGLLPTSTIGSIPQSAHNTVLDVAADLGFVGLITWLVLIAATIRTGWRAAKVKDGEERAVLIGSVAAVAAFAVGGLFVTAELTLPFWLAVALIGRHAGANPPAAAPKAGKLPESGNTALGR